MSCGIIPCVTVNTGTVTLIEQFGKFTKIARPGLNVVIPCFCEFPAATVSMRLQQMEVSCETKTKDNVFVVIKVAVQYQVNEDEESIKNAHYRLTNPKQQIESYVFDVVRSSVPKIELDDVFTTKEEIAQTIKHELTTAMTSFGYTILASPITDIDPDKEVKRAMNDINKAKRLRLAAQDRQLDRATHPSIYAPIHPSHAPIHPPSTRPPIPTHPFHPTYPRTRAKPLRSGRSRRQKQRRRARRSRPRPTPRPSSSPARVSRASGRRLWRACGSRSTPSRTRCRTSMPRPSWTS